MTTKLSDEVGFQYYETLPKGFKNIHSPSELLVLKPNKRKFIPDNVELIPDGEVAVYSAKYCRYYIRTLHDNPYNQTSMLNTISKGIVYVCYGEESRKRIQNMFKACNMTYDAMVLHNDATYQLEVLIKAGRYSEGIKSKIEALENDLAVYEKRTRR